jgi:hypothetical protein
MVESLLRPTPGQDYHTQSSVCHNPSKTDHRKEDYGKNLPDSGFKVTLWIGL